MRHFEFDRTLNFEIFPKKLLYLIVERERDKNFIPYKLIEASVEIRDDTSISIQ